MRQKNVTIYVAWQQEGFGEVGKRPAREGSCMISEEEMKTEDNNILYNMS